jgi:hypothetical protein
VLELPLSNLSAGWFAAAYGLLLAVLFMISGSEIGETSAIEVVQVLVLCAASIIWFAIGFSITRMDRLQYPATFLPLALTVGALAFAAMGREVNFGRIWGFDWGWIVAWKMATGLLVLAVLVAALKLWIKGEASKRQALALMLRDRITLLLAAAAGLFGLADLFDKQLLGGSLNVHLEESAELLAYLLLLLTAVDRISNRWHTARSTLLRYDLTSHAREQRAT